MEIPSENIHEQRSCRTFHRLDLDLGLGSHGRVGLFQWIEVQNCGDDLVGDGRACSEKCAKAIEGCIDEDGITGSIASGLRSRDSDCVPVHTRRPR